MDASFQFDAPTFTDFSAMTPGSNADQWFGNAICIIICVCELSLAYMTETLAILFAYTLVLNLQPVRRNSNLWFHSIEGRRTGGRRVSNNSKRAIAKNIPAVKGAVSAPIALKAKTPATNRKRPNADVYVATLKRSEAPLTIPHSPNISKKVLSLIFDQLYLFLFICSFNLTKPLPSIGTMCMSCSFFFVVFKCI